MYPVLDFPNDLRVFSRTGDVTGNETDENTHDETIVRNELTAKAIAVGERAKIPGFVFSEHGNRRGMVHQV